ncbi:formate C-acetyltransferase [Akkermansia sp.]|uniref:formate C-acetyltransferase n=4 Tax=Akkermansia sp. TaxID=1872421 RepID=UPI003AAE9CBB
MISIVKDLKESPALPQEWQGFKPGAWTESIDVRDFIQNNYTPYSGNEEFLSGPSQRTLRLWEELKVLLKREIDNGGVLDADQEVVSSIVSHKPGYIDKELEVVVGLQTDAPLKRALMPFGGLRMAQQALESYGFKMCEKTADIFNKIRKTHNEGVFDAYTSDIRAARSAGIITGLPDAYGRGRIIGDYRRVALYGTDKLIAERRKDLKNRENSPLTDELIRLREEMSEQIRALEELARMGASYGCDLSRPAGNAREAVQWTYLGYLAAVKEQNGAAMSLGRVSTFFDIYFTRDLEQGLITEEGVQEIIDQFVMKLRIVRFIRTPDYNNLFSGDPTWVTESIGGMGEDGRTLVTRSSFRMLQTLYNLGPAPEPNLTVLWSGNLPEAFKNFCARVSIETSSVQYENDDLMRPHWGDDYGIACCVSAMRIGKQMQFFGARANLAKCLLYALNGGVDELKGKQVAPPSPRYTEEVLKYDEVMALYDKMQDWLAKTYVDALNIIHYMHDKYCYERIEMALHDPEILRTMATGIAGLSVAADSLSAIKYATVKAVRNEEGLIVDFKTEGEFPCYGNNDPRVDEIACSLVSNFMEKLRKLHTYRNSLPTQSILTITSNVVYGKYTGALPDGRAAFTPFAPGANPSYGAEQNGLLASLNSVAKLPYHWALDGISNTQTINPDALGHSEGERVENLVQVMDGYFDQGAHHLNVNVFGKEKLIDAMEHPEKEEYANFTIRVSGYAVKFIDLTREQQMDVISRTCHAAL